MIQAFANADGASSLALIGNSMNARALITGADRGYWCSAVRIPPGFPVTQALTARVVIGAVVGGTTGNLAFRLRTTHVRNGAIIGNYDITTIYPISGTWVVGNVATVPLIGGGSSTYPASTFQVGDQFACHLIRNGTNVLDTCASTIAVATGFDVNL